MKILLILILLLNFTACADNKVIDNKEYKTYGLLNKDNIKNHKIYYTISIGNIIWSIILFETIVAPMYFIGFSLYEPECVIEGDFEKGTNPCY